MAVKQQASAADVITNLRNHFSQPAFCFLEQVADGTGARRFRWADAVAMSVWPSRGYDIHGIEVKVSRYDWLKELSQPEKSAAVQQYCNRWWIATPDESIIQPGELPPTWGWMVLKDKIMRVVREAPALTPKAVSVEFVASILRNFARADEVDVERKIHAAVSKATEEAGEYLRTHYENLKKSCAEFEKKSGLHINEYTDGGDLGDAVNTLRNLKYRVGNIENAIKSCADISAMLEKVQILASLKDGKESV